MYADPKESCIPGSRDNGPTHTGRPGGCVPGSLVPTHLYTAARDHLDGGRLGVPVHLGVNNWAYTASMTQLFTQVIPGLGSLHRYTETSEQIEYMPIAPKGYTMVLT